MEIILKTHKHCIETVAKRTYENILKRWFKVKMDEASRQSIETDIEVLKFFLEHADFRILRGAHPELEKGGDTDVTLQVDLSSQEMTLQFTDNKINPPRKSTPKICA